MDNLELMQLAKIKHSTRVLKGSRNAQTLVKSELDLSMQEGMTHICLPTHWCQCSRVVKCDSVSLTTTKLFNQHNKYISK